MARHKARAALIAVLIALPVAMLCGLGVLQRYEVPGPQDHALSAFGDADLIIEAMAGWSGRCTQESLADTACGAGSVDTVSASNLSRQQQALRSIGDSAASTTSTSPLLPGHPVIPVRTAHVTADWQGLDVAVTVVGADQIRLRTAKVRLPAGATTMPGPGEVWVGKDTAERYGWTVGHTMQIGTASYRVTGLTRVEPLSGPSVWVGPGHPLVATGELSWFGTGAPVSRAQADLLNSHGLAVMDRQAYLDLQSDGPAGDGATVTMLTLSVGVLAALVTATVAGAAFAIGARQQRRTLALLGATGADRRVMQQLVTRQGLVLGVVGSVLGAGLGLAGGNGYLAWIGAHNPYYPPSAQISVGITAAALVVGVVSALVAAWVPARAVARQDVLAGVRHAETPSGPARLPRLGLGLVLSGVVLVVAAAVIFHLGSSATDAQEHTQTLFIPVIVGQVVIFIGMVASLSWCVDRAARGRGGPLGVRFALRDLARNRGRGAACVAASMAVMALMASILTVAGSQDIAETRRYLPQLPPGTAVLASTDAQGKPLTAERAADQIAAVEAELGPVPQRVRSQQLRTCDTDLSDSGLTWCSAMVSVVSTTATRVSPDQGVIQDPDGHRSYTLRAEVVVDDGSLYHLLTGHRATPEVLRAMDRGVVILNPALATGGRATAEITRNQGEDPIDRRVAVFTAAATVGGNRVPALTTRAMAARLAGMPPEKLPLVPGDTWLRLPVAPTSSQIDRINAAIARRTTVQQAFEHESGPAHSYRAVLRWGTLVAAVLLVAVAVVVLALSLSDSRTARQSVAAVGASRRDLKRITAVQSLVTVGIGGVAGALVGVGPIALAMWAQGPAGSWGVPWGYLAALVLGVPVIVAAAVRVLVPAVSPVLRRRD
ncbi:FtsX-like permease family protein [Acidipropionibacterium jensenii]|uniref:FtsX-like permease family protein n=1 Tax=Acidipropionibacterium jensenii TaxID=1749 RepID=UPI000491802D|nr:FtsX-like permease family protein [Acidipropionibacterium jensenii]